MYRYTSTDFNMGSSAFPETEAERKARLKKKAEDR